jgi:hypothetical protein
VQAKALRALGIRDRHFVDCEFSHTKQTIHVCAMIVSKESCDMPDVMGFDSVLGLVAGGAGDGRVLLASIAAGKPPQTHFLICLGSNKCVYVHVS